MSEDTASRRDEEEEVQVSNLKPEMKPGQTVTCTVHFIFEMTCVTFWTWLPVAPAIHEALFTFAHCIPWGRIELKCYNAEGGSTKYSRFT